GAYAPCGASGSYGASAYEPYELTGKVVALREADEVGGDLAAVRHGGVTTVLVSRRKPFRTRADFGELGPREYDLLVVKAGCPAPELYALAADWQLALTPGSVDQDLPRLGHHRLERPLFPFDPDMPAPDLTPELL
ncbi:MlrC C-terminal domain-containing protein, partial [Streptomyces milbemycinicus]